MQVYIEKCSKCGSIPQAHKWSASYTIFIKCDCGRRSDDCTSESYDWAYKKAVRNWNRYN